MPVLGPFSAYLREHLPPSSAPAPKTNRPFEDEMIQRRTRGARRHNLGLWDCPRCDPGSAAWFSVARVLGQCAEKSGDAAVKDETANDCGDVDVSTSVHVQVYVVF